jgi:hypothetical protein
MSAATTFSNCCDDSGDTVIDKYALILSSAKSIEYNIKELIYTFIFYTWNRLWKSHKICTHKREGDLGSSAGIDVFFASNIVKENGKVIGIDMTIKRCKKQKTMQKNLSTKM